MTPAHPHPQRPEVIQRLRRIEGHVSAVRRMAEEGRSCADVLHQIRAVEAALRRAAVIVMEDHMEECIVGAIDDETTRELLADLREVFSSYMR